MKQQILIFFLATILFQSCSTQRNHLNLIENISLPDLNLYNIEGKVDTGAGYSTLHVQNLKIIKQDTSTNVTFDHPPKLNIQSKVVKFVKIISSTGEKTIRPLIETTIILKNQKFSTKITLIDRSKLKYKFLIGKKTIQNKFLIQP